MPTLTPPPPVLARPPFDADELPAGALTAYVLHGPSWPTVIDLLQQQLQQGRRARYAYTDPHRTVCGGSSVRHSVPARYAGQLVVVDWAHLHVTRLHEDEDVDRWRPDLRDAQAGLAPDALLVIDGPGYLYPPSGELAALAESRPKGRTVVVVYADDGGLYERPVPKREDYEDADDWREDVAGFLSTREGLRGSLTAAHVRVHVVPVEDEAQRSLVFVDRPGRPPEVRELEAPADRWSDVDVDERGNVLNPCTCRDWGLPACADRIAG